jgi:hypothetical protein
LIVLLLLLLLFLPKSKEEVREGERGRGGELISYELNGSEDSGGDSCHLPY